MGKCILESRRGFKSDLEPEPCLLSGSRGCQLRHRLSPLWLRELSHPSTFLGLSFFFHEMGVMTPRDSVGTTETM